MYRISTSRFKTLLLAVLVLATLAYSANHFATGIINSAGTERVTADVQVKEITGYKTWTKVNSAPQLMPARVANSCGTMLTSSPTNVDVDGQGNPHRDKYFTVYVNDVGKKAMLTHQNPKFPVGSVIVKEKLSAQDSQTPELLTVMIKQKKGFNPATGDWEYMIVDGSGTKVVGRGNLQSCHGCHIANAKTGYVFRTYLSAETENELK